MTKMKKYHLSQTVQAQTMTRQEYNDLRGWQLPEDENPADEGYLVVSSDHRTWVPKETFESHYRDGDGNLSFSEAMAAVSLKGCVTRLGWSDKEVFVVLIQGSNDFAKLKGYGFGEYAGEPVFEDALFLLTGKNTIKPWSPTLEDLLANDWSVR